MNKVNNTNIYDFFKEYRRELLSFFKMTLTDTVLWHKNNPFQITHCDRDYIPNTFINPWNVYVVIQRSPYITDEYALFFRNIVFHYYGGAIGVYIKENSKNWVYNHWTNRIFSMSSYGHVNVEYTSNENDKDLKLFINALKYFLTNNKS